MHDVSADSNIALKYDGKRYVFVLPDNAQRAKCLDKELQEWMGAVAILHSRLYGSAVPRKNINADLSKEEASAICLRKHTPDEGLASSRSLKKTLEEFFIKTNTLGKIEFATNKYRLTVPNDCVLSSQFVRALSEVMIKEEGNVKHVICKSLATKYCIMVEASEIVSYKVSIPPSYYDAPVTLLNA